METHRLTPLELRIREDFFWGQTSPEVQQHLGKLVVIRNKQVLAIGTDQNALMAEAVAKEGCDPEDLVVVLVPRLDLQELPH